MRYFCVILFQVAIDAKILKRKGRRREKVRKGGLIELLEKKKVTFLEKEREK